MQKHSILGEYLHFDTRGHLGYTEPLIYSGPRFILLHLDRFILCRVFFPPNVYLAAPSLSGSMQDLSVQFSRSVVSNSETPWAAARQASLSITNSQSLLKLMSTESVMPSNHLVLCHPLLPSSIYPASGSFPVNQFIASGGQSTGTSTSASVLPMNIQD